MVSSVTIKRAPVPGNVSGAGCRAGRSPVGAHLMRDRGRAGCGSVGAAVAHEMRSYRAAPPHVPFRANRGTRDGRTTADRHAADHLRQSARHQRLRLRRVRRARRAPGCTSCCAAWASPRSRAIAAARSRAIARAGSISWSTRRRTPSPRPSPPQHGPSACGFAIRVADGERALREVTDARRRSRSPALADTRAVAAPVIKGIGDCMLYLVTDGSDPSSPTTCRSRAPTRSDRLRPDLHRPPHPQPATSATWSKLGRLLRAPVRLPRDPLLRHQGQQDRPGVEGDDRARRRGADPAQRVHRPEVADQRVPRRSTRARASSTSPASPTTSTPRSRSDARRRASSFLDTPDTYFDVIDARIPDHGEDVARMRATTDPDRRRPGNQAAQAAADLHRDQDRPDLLRDHPAQGQRRLRRGQFPGPVREHRARPDAARGALSSVW